MKLIYGSIHENATLVQLKWMSVLQGPTGSPGEQGPKGENGPQVCRPVPGLWALGWTPCPWFSDTFLLHTTAQQPCYVPSVPSSRSPFTACLRWWMLCDVSPYWLLPSSDFEPCRTVNIQFHGAVSWWCVLCPPTTKETKLSLKWVNNICSTWLWEKERREERE